MSTRREERRRRRQTGSAFLDDTNIPDDSTGVTANPVQRERLPPIHVDANQNISGENSTAGQEKNQPTEIPNRRRRRRTNQAAFTEEKIDDHQSMQNRTMDESMDRQESSGVSTPNNAAGVPHRARRQISQTSVTSNQSNTRRETSSHQVSSRHNDFPATSDQVMEENKSEDEDEVGVISYQQKRKVIAAETLHEHGSTVLTPEIEYRYHDPSGQRDIQPVTFIEDAATGEFHKRKNLSRQAAHQRTTTSGKLPASQRAPPAALISNWLNFIFLLVQGLATGGTLFAMILSFQYDNDTERILGYGIYANPVQATLFVLLAISCVGSAQMSLQSPLYRTAHQRIPAAVMHSFSVEKSGRKIVNTNSNERQNPRNTTSLAFDWLQLSSHRQQMYGTLATILYGLASICTFLTGNVIAWMAASVQDVTYITKAEEKIDMFKVLLVIRFILTLLGWICTVKISRWLVNGTYTLLGSFREAERNFNECSQQLARLEGLDRESLNLSSLQQLHAYQIQLAQATEATIAAKRLRSRAN